MDPKERRKMAELVESAAYNSLDVADTSDPLTLARAIANAVMAAMAEHNRRYLHLPGND